MEHDEELTVLSIDIGIINLGYVFAKIKLCDYSKIFNVLLRRINKKHKDEYSNDVKNMLLNNVNIIDCNRVDITNVKHNRINRCDCLLHHDFCIPDYVDHFIQEHQELFDNSDLILLERQPPVGITNVQDLLFSKFRNKIIMISPVQIHRYFKLSKDYFIRKEDSEYISQDFLKLFKQFNNNIRKHDITDSLLMLLYYHKVKSCEFFKNLVKDSLIDFEKFRI